VLFCTQVGLALATEVTKLAQNMPYLGALKYKCALYINFFRSTGLRCELWLDGKLVRNGPMKLLQIQNAPKIGGGIKSAPLAQMDDGLLDVVVGYSDSKLKILYVARKAQEGKHIFDPEVSYYRAREVVLRGEEGIEFMVDGELVEGGEEVRVSLIRDWVYLI
jgi:diacylglycerol kinase (ATP)